MAYYTCTKCFEYRTDLVVPHHDKLCWGCIKDPRIRDYAKNLLLDDLMNPASARMLRSVVNFEAEERAKAVAEKGT